MASDKKPLDFLWFIPSSGDGAYLGSDDLSRPVDPGYFREIARAADRLGYSGVLIPRAWPARNPSSSPPILPPIRSA